MPGRWIRGGTVLYPPAGDTAYNFHRTIEANFLLLLASSIAMSDRVEIKLGDIVGLLAKVQVATGRCNLKAETTDAAEKQSDCCVVIKARRQSTSI